MEKRIIINGRFLTQRITGVQRYQYEMLLGIDYNLKDDCSQYSFELLCPKGKLINIPKLKNIQIVQFGNLNGHLWEQIDLRRYKSDNKSILISLTASGPIYSTDLVVIHDVVSPSRPRLEFDIIYKMWFKFKEKKLIDNAKTIITISNFSKKEILNNFSPKKSIQVIYEGYEHIDRIKEDNSILSRLNLQDKKFFFSLGTIKANKNIGLILKAANKLKNYIFVITGGFNKKIFKSSNLNFDQLDNVIYTGYLKDEEIKTLYSNCEAFIFPSLYEGFGLPPLEARVCGANLILSDIEPLREVYGNQAVYIDPYDENSLIETIMKRRYKEVNNNISDLKNKYSWLKNSKLILNEITKLIQKILEK
ncbi:MAG: glycosyltransferase family 4 protein [Flexistipes sinusarabici]|uniref:Glycosyltransferase family 4 protein n=1 Tax=Flexistipes sinusarabici TaxID=2352 RepID=A0A5D0MPK2_FLESI|nr:glycosyltransferase family 1 protein [Flexistipes sinusarabici]TYB33248.1 MAG: glycosyltransferase family 4 protein [Flexistipes sinusarabici]